MGGIVAADNKLPAIIVEATKLRNIGMDPSFKRQRIAFSVKPLYCGNRESA
jgi:hypothetical protein